jgi:uncharacterized protein (DUF2141 family)
MMNAKRISRSELQGETSIATQPNSFHSHSSFCNVDYRQLAPATTPRPTDVNADRSSHWVKKRQGTGCIRLWNKKDGFPSDDRKAFRTIEVPITTGSASAVFTGIPFGKYAVNAWHDENKNGKFDTRFSVIPLEGYGISNGTRGKMGPPPFDPSVFAVDNITTTVPIAVLY